MFLLIDLPGELAFPFNSGMRQDTNTTVMANLIGKYYGKFKDAYKDYQTVEGRLVQQEHITNMLRDVLAGNVKFLDSQKYDLLSFEHDARHMLYLDVFLFDYLGIDRE